MKYTRISKLFNAAAIASIAATLPLNYTFAANSAESEGSSLLVLGAVALIVGLALALFGFRHFKQYQNEADEDSRKRGVLMAGIMFAVAMAMFGLGGWSIMGSSSDATLAGAGIEDAPIAVSGNEAETVAADASGNGSETVAAPSVVVRDEDGNIIQDNSLSDDSAFSLELGGNGQGDLASAAPPELIIPDLDLERSVVTVPITNGEWNLEGLDHNIGWLASTGAKPNDDFAMVLAAHVTLTASETGPFHKLASMAPGSRFTYRWDGVDYIYEMGAKRVVSPDAVRDLYVEDGSKLILVTCTTWDPSLEAYSERVLAEATLIEQVPAPTTNTN